MDSIDKAIECVYQALLIIEESKDQMLETLGIPAAEGAGVPPASPSSKVDGRIDRLSGINARLQDTQVGMVAIQGELDKI